MPQAWLSLLHIALAYGVCFLAMIFGSWRERVGAMAFITVSIFGSIIASQWPQYGRLPILGLDLLCLIVFIRLCWKAPHPWPIWASACQCLNLMCSLVSSSATPTWALTTALLISGYGVVLSILMGTVATLRRRRAATKPLAKAHTNAPIKK